MLFIDFVWSGSKAGSSCEGFLLVAADTTVDSAAAVAAPTADILVMFYTYL